VQAAFGEAAVDYYGSVFALALALPPPVAPWRAPPAPGAAPRPAPVPLAVVLETAAAAWWAADPRDAPNRGWETERPCAALFGPAAVADRAAGGGPPVEDCEWAAAAAVAWGLAAACVRVLVQLR
jgi:hypothetical protein